MTFTIMMDMLMSNTLMPRFNPLRLASTGFTSRIDIFDGFHYRVCVLPLIERMFSLQVGSLAIPNLQGPNES